jgi:CRP/FNR family cyclic AMP-dependent transcriptional regulator
VHGSALQAGRGGGTLAPMRAVPTSETVLPARGRLRRASPRHRADVRRVVVALGTVPLFDGFSRRHLRSLAEQAEVVRFDAGRAIVEEGQAGEAMYVILGGTARVERRGRRVASLVPGDFFGELSALDGGPRTASVVADTALEVVRVHRQTLRRMVEREPALVLGLLVGLARRLRQVMPGPRIG